MQTLVVFYSRTGHTRKVAEELAGALQCDVEEIVDEVNRAGPIGWLNSGRQAANKTLTRLQPIKNDPSKYDVVVVGTPIWSRNISTPVRTYITENNAKLKNVAFFCTESSTGDEEVFKEMGELCSRKPKATLAIKHSEYFNGSYVDKVKKFAGEIEGR